MTLQYEVEVGGRLRQARVSRADGKFIVEIDGNRWTVDAERVDSESLSLLIDEALRFKLDTRSSDETRRLDPAPTSLTTVHEVTVAPDGGPGRLAVSVGTKSVAVSLDRRHGTGRRRGGTAGDDPQRILAPMPGRVVRVLVRPGEAVHARQPVMVIEAMKMENELRAGREGIVTEIHAREGQSVEARELLAVVVSSEGTC